MKKSLLFLILSVASFVYGSYSIFKMVWQNQTPLIIECIGVELDPAKKYSISNSLPKSSHTLVINYPQGRGILPDTLGFIMYDSAKHSFELRTSHEIILPAKEANGNPFGAFSRTIDDSFFQKPKYFGPDSSIPSEVLQNYGVKFNSIFGDRSSRTSLRLLDFENKTYLSTSTEGIGTKYELQAVLPNRISVICDKIIKSDASRVFFFENTTSDKCANTIEIIPSSIFDFSYSVLGEDGEIIATGNNSSRQFEVGDYLFRIYAKYSMFDIGFLIFSLIILLGFQIFFIKSHFNAKTPPVRSIIAIRLLLNCMAFLSVPLYLLALSVTSNRWAYLLCLLILNGSYFTSKRFLHNFDFNLNIWWEMAIWFAVFLLPPFLYFFAANESLFGVPVLHIQKMIILGLIFVTNGDLFSRLNYRYRVKLFSILAYTLLLSWITSDIGSFLYTLIAFLLIEIVRKSISLKVVIFYFSLLMAGIFLCYHISDNTFADRKLYRLVAPYTSPDSEKLSQANQADRETFSSLHLIQKNLLEGSVPELNKIVVPASMRSTSFSDFAVFWSLIFGKSIFAILFFVTQFQLLFEFAFLLTISIRTIRINSNQAFLLPINRESEFVRFLLAFAIVTFTYPVLSNLLLVPLTGQSFPCLSISIVEIIFLPFFLIPIASIFNDPKYVRSAPHVTHSYFDVTNRLKFVACISVLLMVAAITLKLIDLKGSSDHYRWEKLAKEGDWFAVSIDPADKSALVKTALEAIGNDELTQIQTKKKSYLRNLASLYYLDRPYNQLHFESSFYENSCDSIANRMNIDSRFLTRSKVVSGPLQPFGNVLSFNQIVNGKNRLVYTNDYYASIPQNAESINGDLTAELSRKLSDHLLKIGVPSNIGSILIVNNSTGAIITNSTYPLISEINSNEIHYNIGSLKKIIIAYCALVIDSEYKQRIYNNRSFQGFVKWSDDVYAASLLKDIMLNHEQEFKDILHNDLDLSLISPTEDAYFDEKPDLASYSKPLDRRNEIYRYSIGQQKPYQFIKVVEWYSRIASGKKLRLNYNGREAPCAKLSISDEELAFLKKAMNEVLTGTGANVGSGLSQNAIWPASFIAKTGTAESATKKYNSSSSFILANNEYTIGIMLAGKIPNNSQNLAAKDLMVSIMPILKKYRLL